MQNEMYEFYVNEASRLKRLVEEKDHYLSKVNENFRLYMEGDALTRGMALMEIRLILNEAGYE